MQLQDYYQFVKNNCDNLNQKVLNVNKHHDADSLSDEMSALKITFSTESDKNQPISVLGSSYNFSQKTITTSDQSRLTEQLALNVNQDNIDENSKLEDSTEEYDCLDDNEVEDNYWDSDDSIVIIEEEKSNQVNFIYRLET